jgi:hypothetical protein
MVNLDTEPGRFAKNVQAFIDSVGVDGEEATLIGDLMLFNARLLDNIAATGDRWHLAGSSQKTLLELKAQLRRLADAKAEAKPGGPAAAGDDPAGGLEGFLGGLTSQA